MIITAITVKDRGPTPRRLQKVYTAGARVAWSEAGKYYHGQMRPQRFTEAHGIAAGFAPRQGANLPFMSKSWKRSYVGRKMLYKKHRHPLEWSGSTKRGSALATIATTRVQAKVKYPNVRVLNFKPKLQEEFRRLLPTEARHLGRIYDRELTNYLKKERGTETRSL